MKNTAQSLDCMTYIAGKAASKTGYVLVGHNEDDGVYASVRHGYVPGTEWPDGTLLPAEKGRAQVPQINHTFGYYWTQTRAPEGGLCAADSFFNENGVCVVSNSSSGSKDYDESSGHPDGGVCYELRRIIAERASTARHGLEIAISIIKEYGYASPGRIYTIADCDEAFMLQIVYGKRYIAARIPDDALVIMPNHYTFHTLKDVPEMYYPDDLITHALETGRYTPGIPGDYSDFDFAKAYQNTTSYRSAGNILRQKYGTQILLNREYDAEGAGYPFCVKAERKVGCQDIMRALSTHYEGTECDKRCCNGLSPHFFTGVRRVCTGTTLESAVYELSPIPWQSTVWTAFGRPCELPYIPIHPLCDAVSAIDAMAAPAAEAETHHLPKPGAICHRGDGWQKCADFANALELVYSKEIQNVSDLKRRLEKKFLADNAKNVVHSKGPDEASARAYLHSCDEELAGFALDELDSATRRLFDTLKVQPCHASAHDNVFNISFASPVALKEDSVHLWFGRSRFETGSVKSTPGSLIQNGGAYTCRFEFEKPPFEYVGTGKYEFFIAGLADDGTPHEGIAIAEIN